MNHNLVMWADRLAVLTFVAGLLALAVALFVIVKRLNARRRARLDGSPALSLFPRNALVFAALLLAQFLLAEVVAHQARKFVAVALAPESNSQVRINGESPLDQPALLAALGTLEPRLGHHSHAGQRIQVEIVSSAGPVVLELGRDSKRPDEYWIFMPRYWVTSTLEIGRITSPAFAGY